MSRAVPADFGTGNLDELFPAWRSNNETCASRIVRDAFAGQLPFADYPQQAMNLIERQHGCGGIVDGWRQGLQGNVDHDAKAEERVLFQRPLGSERDGGSEAAVSYSDSAAIEDEQRLSGRHEISNLRHEFDDAVGRSGVALEAGVVDSEQNLGGAGMTNDPSWTRRGAEHAGDPG